MKQILPLVFVLPVMTACAALPAKTYQSYLKEKGLQPPTPEHFQHCHGYGCKHVSDVTFEESDWAEIAPLFDPPPQTPEEERQIIKDVIGLFERKVGALTGTEEDRLGTFYKLGRYQLDCVDESTNTTVYLSILQAKGLLNFHDIELPNARWPIVHSGRWPHQTAVITDQQSGESYVVDSWFHHNGAPAEIVPLKEWKQGWKPEKKDDSL